jgi:hypothetical protein
MNLRCQEDDNVRASWNEAEDTPLADRNPYVGPQAVGEGVFGRLMAAINNFTAVAGLLRRAGRRELAYFFRLHCIAKAESLLEKVASIWSVGVVQLKVVPKNPPPEVLCGGPNRLTSAALNASSLS